MKKKFNAAVRHEDPDRYYTKNDHLFVLTGPSGTGKHVIATILEEQGIAGYEITLDLKDGVEGSFNPSYYGTTVGTGLPPTIRHSI